MKSITETTRIAEAGDIVRHIHKNFDGSEDIYYGMIVGIWTLNAYYRRVQGQFGEVTLPKPLKEAVYAVWSDDGEVAHVTIPDADVFDPETGLWEAIDSVDYDPECFREKKSPLSTL